jgi:hypothetical protein
VDDIEEWRPWRDGTYEVSSHGRFRRAKPGRNTHAGKVIAQSVSGSGYYMVGPTINGRNVPTPVHWIVAEVFIGERPDGMWINHIDHNPLNNRPSNLEYCTPRENSRAAVVAGKIRTGSASHACRHSFGTCEEMRADRAAGMPYQKIADKHGVSVGHAWSIINNKRRVNS